MTTQLTNFLAAERRDIESQQRHVLSQGRSQANLRIFCRLEGRLEQLLAIEAWLASVEFEPEPIKVLVVH